MKTEEAFARRVSRWEKLKDYFVPGKVQEAINKELVKRSTYERQIKFSFDPEDWLVVSWVPVFYYWYGAESKDEAERISYIEVTGEFFVNGVKRGPRSTLKIFPPTRNSSEFSFHNIDEVINGVLCDRQVKPDEDEFLLANIMNDESAPPSRLETEALVERLTEALVEMGYSRRGAARLASETVASQPHTATIDDLLEIAVNGTL